MMELTRRILMTLLLTALFLFSGFSDTPASTAVTKQIIEPVKQIQIQRPEYFPPKTDIAVSEAVYDIPATEPETKDVKVLMSFAGDCTIGTDETFGYTNSFTDMFKKQKNDCSYFFGGVKDIFQADDLTLVNLETTFTKATAKADKKFRFKGDPEYVNILKAGSIEMVNIANNHIYDYLQKGFDDTVETLKTAGIYYSGLGNVSYYDVKGITVASLGYKIWDNPSPQKLKSDIAKACESADLVVVSFHWGIERSYYPNEAQLKLGRLSIDCGADIVIGHHPHVIQGIELYKDKYIVYSLGNFCFGGNKNPTDKDTMIFQAEFTMQENKLEACVGRIIPCSISSVKHINDYRPTVLEGEEGRRVLDRIYTYSKSLKYGIQPE